jgi:hypothetical protein
VTFHRHVCAVLCSPYQWNIELTEYRLSVFLNIRMILSTLQCCSDRKTFSFFHRVYSTEFQAFSPVVRIGSPPPHPSVAPHPLVPGVGARLRERGRGGANSDEGTDTLHGTLGIVHPSTAFFISLKSSCKNVYNQHIFKVHHLSIQQIFAALPTCLYKGSNVHSVRCVPYG